MLIKNSLVPYNYSRVINIVVHVYVVDNNKKGSDSITKE
jgi:hypothetical protein